MKNKTIKLIAIIATSLLASCGEAEKETTIKVEHEKVDVDAQRDAREKELLIRIANLKRELEAIEGDLGASRAQEQAAEDKLSAGLEKAQAYTKAGVELVRQKVHEATE
jgi:hypothetical protein